MKLENRDLLLYLVTDRRWLEGENLGSIVEEAIKNGVTFVQLREKNLEYNEFKELAFSIKEITDKYKIPFVINDNIEVAIEVDTDGVHIGQDDIEVEKARKLLGKDKILGVSAGNMEQALDAEAKGADYIGVGAAFPTSSKDDVSGIISLEDLRLIKERVDIPVVAIAGINHENIHLLEPSKIDGVAVISAILAKEDIGTSTKDLSVLANKYLGGK